MCFFALAAAYKERFDETALWFGTFATGLACGVVTQPQTFRGLVRVFEEFVYLYRLLRRSDPDAATTRYSAHRHALQRGIRTFRGVPDLTQPGVCYTKDVLYVRGLQKLEKAMQRDGEAVLKRLAVGVVALEQLSDLEELGIVEAPRPLLTLAQDPDLENHILSFAEQDSDDK